MGAAVGSALDAEGWVFPAPQTSKYDESHESLVWFPTGAGGSVPAMLLPPAEAGVCGGSEAGRFRSASSKARSCVIYFHANAEDIGECLVDMERLRDGVFAGDAAVLAPEYPGYGLLRDFDASTEGIDIAAGASWQYCRHSLGFREDQIVLWGRSIGTGPAAALAAALGASAGAVDAAKTATLRPLGALVLQTPFTSVSDVVMAHSNAVIASLLGHMWDVLELVAEPGLQKVPFCVVHPKSDEVVPVSQGQAVCRAAASELKYGIWPPVAGHNDPLTPDQLLAIRVFLAEHMLWYEPSLEADEESTEEEVACERLVCCWHMPGTGTATTAETDRRPKSSRQTSEREEARIRREEALRRREEAAAAHLFGVATAGLEPPRGWES